MNSEHVKNAAISTLVAATLVTGVVVLGPGRDGQGPHAAPGAAARAQAATVAGVPAALRDLTALISDREQWLGAHPRDEESWAVLGAAYVQRGTRLADWDAFPKAESALRRSLELLPEEQGNIDALVGLAALANARHDFIGARVVAERAVRQQPKRWTAYPVLIDACTGAGDYKAVGKAMETLLELHPGSQSLGRAAQVFRNRGWREDAAANAYDSVSSAEDATEKAAALHRLGDLAWERGEPLEAVESYDRALKLAPDLYPALMSRGRALAAAGRTDEAFRDHQAALEKVPLPEYALEAAELYESMGLNGDALTQYELMRTSAEAARSRGVNVELVLGRYEADHGDPETAVHRLKGEWDRKRRSIQVADALGWALFRAGRPKDALPYAKKATDEGLRSPLFSYHRGEIERALGQNGPARRHLAEALRINPYFSPLLAPMAREALAALGELPDGGPRKVTGKERESGQGAEGATASGTPSQPARSQDSAGAGSSGTGSGSGSSGTGYQQAPSPSRSPARQPSPTAGNQSGQGESGAGRGGQQAKPTGPVNARPGRD